MIHHHDLLLLLLLLQSNTFIFIKVIIHIVAPPLGMATKEEHVKEQTSTKEETSTKEDLASGWHAADQLTLHRIASLQGAPTPPHLWRYVEVAKMTCAVCREFHANTPLFE